MDDSQETTQRINRFMQSVSHLGLDLMKETELEQGCETDSNFQFLSPNMCTKQLASSYCENKLQSCRSNINVDSGVDMQLRKRIKHFVASKADLIFKFKGKEKWRSGIDYNADSSLEAYELFATQVPPLETEMQISATVRRAHMFQILKVGDIIVGKVVGKRPFGIFVSIISLMHGRNLDFSEIDIQAMCHKSELDHKSREHLDPVDDFEINDIVQGVICSVSIEEERIAISFRSSKLPSEYGNIELGIIEDADEHRDRMQPFDEDIDYNDHLRKDPGFSNPTNVQTLINVLGINTNPPCSLLRSCQQWSFDGEEDVTSLRKQQSLKWSMDTTAVGVENFKCGSHEKAMKYFNHALQIYEANAEALVARGALYANENKLENAIKDFREALKVHPKHHNAYKYLKETLFEKAVRIQKIGNINEAIDIFQEILSLDPHNTKSQDHLRELQSLMSTKCEEGRSKEHKPSKGSTKESCHFEHVRKLIKADPDLVRASRKKKRKKKQKDFRHKKHSPQKKVLDESTSTASEGGDYSDGDEWVEKKVDTKLGLKSGEKTEKPQVKDDDEQNIEERGEQGRSESCYLESDNPVLNEAKNYESLKILRMSMMRQNERKGGGNNNRGKEKEERKSLNQAESNKTMNTRNDLNRDPSQRNHGSRSRSRDSRSRSRSSRSRSRSSRSSDSQSRSRDSRSRSRDSRRRSRSSRSRSHDSRRRSRDSQSRSRDSRSRGRGSRSRSDRESPRKHKEIRSGTRSRSISKDRRVCRSTKRTRGASRNTSRDIRAYRSSRGSRGGTRSTGRDRRARRSISGSRGVSRSTSGSRGSRRSTSRDKRAR